MAPTNSDLTVNIQRRGVLKARLTRFQSYLEEFDTRTHDVHALEARLDTIKLIWKEFDDIQFRIEGLDNTEAQTAERVNFEETYMRLVEFATSMIRRRESSAQLRETTPTMQIGTPNLDGINHRIKLPTMHLPTFDGSYDKWLNFHDTFQALVDNNMELSEIQKFYYLRSALRDAAADVIQSLEVSAENYAIAWDLLKRRFDNRQYLVTKHIQALLDLSALQRESGTLMRKLVDDIQKHVRALRTMKADNWDTVVVHLLNLKLDRATQREWRVERSKHENFTLDDFIKFMETQATIVDTDKFNKTKPNDFPNAKRHGTARTGRGTEPVATYVSMNQDKCPSCKGFHRLYKCHKFQSMSVQQRVNEVDRLRICPICLRDHSGRECSWKGCRLCNGRHNTYLHTETSQVTALLMSDEEEDADATADLVPQQQEEHAVSDVSVAALMAGGRATTRVLLSTAIVLIKDRFGRYQECRALLDSGSQSHLMTRRLCERLQLDRLPRSIGIQGIGGHTSGVAGQATTMNRSRLNGYQAQMTFYIINKIADRLPDVTLDTSKIKIPEKLTLADPGYYISGPVDILIGASIFWDLLAR